MERPSNDLDFTRALRELRPSPRPEFAAELDARRAAGFPPRGAGRRSAIQRIAARLTAIPPRRLLVPAGACALVAIAIATAVIATTETEPKRMALSGPTTAGGGEVLNAHGGHPAEGSLAHLNPQGERLAKEAPHHLKPFSAALAGPAAASANHNGSGHYLKGYNSKYSGEVDRNAGNVAHSAVGAGSAPASTPLLGAVNQLHSGPIAAQARHRKIERSALLVLATEAEQVRAAASRVFATVHSYDGIVLNSSIRDGKDGEAGASFDLLVPTNRLSDALASFSAIGEVRTRQESTQDITAPTVGLGERLQDAHARIESLLTQLSEAGSDAERAATEARLRAERRRVANMRSRLSSLQRRASFSRVSLRIESGDAAGTATDDGSWGVGDALDDAAHILAIAAGVTLIGLAILTPIALLCLLIWVARRVWVRRARARALG